MMIFGQSCQKDFVDPVRVVPKLATGEIKTTISHTGIGGFNLDGVSDKVIAFDFDHSGKNDHLLCYRPGAKTV